MFDGVGRDLDAGSAGRRWLAGLVTAGVSCLVVTGLAVGRAPAPSAPAPPSANDLVLIELPADDLDAVEVEILPEAPRSDTGRATVAAGDTGMSDTGFPDDEADSDALNEAADLEDPADDPSALDEQVSDGVADAAPPSTGSPRPGGRSGAGSGSARAAPDPSEDDGAVPQLTRDELVVRRRRKPRYPPIADRQEMGVVDCVLNVAVDSDGEARQVTYQRCPSVFRAHARAAIYDWRWHPFEASGPMDWRQVEVTLTFEP